MLLKINRFGSAVGHCLLQKVFQRCLFCDTYSDSERATEECLLVTPPLSCVHRLVSLSLGKPKEGVEASGFRALSADKLGRGPGKHYILQIFIPTLPSVEKSSQVNMFGKNVAAVRLQSPSVRAVSLPWKVCLDERC